MKPKKRSTLADIILTISGIFYIWYLGSTLLLPLSELAPLPDGFFITLYKLVDFPLSILGFVICVSIISSILILSEFKHEKIHKKIFLIEGLTFMLYFIIPILATIFLLVLVATKVSSHIPDELRISFFLEDLFLFTSILFILTLILNLVMHKIIEKIVD